jgi:hypothetical protein
MREAPSNPSLRASEIRYLRFFPESLVRYSRVRPRQAVPYLKILVHPLPAATALRTTWGFVTNHDSV